jgi:hypothetical protein
MCKGQMRTIWLHILLPSGKTQWREFPWGVHGLRQARLQGTIIGSSQ